MSAAAGEPVIVGIVAGEASGDLLGAHLIKALRARVPHITFVGIGGPKMQAAGMKVLHPMEKLAVRGYVEVLRHYREIAGIRRSLRDWLLANPPRIFIGIDAPDFNLDLERRLKEAGIPTVHYVSPSIWAWRGGRIEGIKRAVNKVLTLFPFEAAIYEKHGVAVDYVGHPLADMLGGHPGRAAAREQLRLARSAPVFALLPGSRVSELEAMADLFVATARRIRDMVPEAVFLCPLVNRETRTLFEGAIYRENEEDPLPVTILFGHAHDAMAAADVVVAASGTVTLEAALLKRAMVIAYRMPRVSYWIMRRMGYLPYVGLPNSLAGEFVVPEFLQDDATPENLAQAAVNLFNDTGIRAALETRFAEILGTLRQNTAEKLQAALLPMLEAPRP
jgi:lipid-A-disaccharide synthase